VFIFVFMFVSMFVWVNTLCMWVGEWLCFVSALACVVCVVLRSQLSAEFVSFIVPYMTDRGPFMLS
jgi:hypothetical protein